MINWLAIGHRTGFAYASGLNAADIYPARSIRMIVPFSAGGAGDIIARLMSIKLAEGLGQQVVIHNRPGGGSVLGTELAARANPDGYTLILVATAHALNPGLLGKLPFDPVEDFAPITLAVETPLIFVVPTSFAVNNLCELITLAKTRPNSLTYGSAGQGTSGHLATELLSFKTGIRILHVPYKGASPALIDLLGAQIQMVCTSTLPALPHVRAGQLRGLAVTSIARSRAAPDIPTSPRPRRLPTIGRAPGMRCLRPRERQRRFVMKVHSAAMRALRSSAVTEQLLAQGAEPVASTPDQLRLFMQNEIDIWTKVIRQANIRPST
jgi:tripartite-type tricarboxylate transporter receptor subunit TctC